MADEPLRITRPSGWNYFWHWVFCWLLIPLVIALWKRASLELRVYADRIELETGVLAKNLKALYIDDIRAIEIKESFLQRLVGIGNISIASAGEASSVITAQGIPDPRGIRELIQELRGAGDTSTLSE